MKCHCMVKKNIEDLSGSYKVYGDGARRLENMLSERLKDAKDVKGFIDTLESSLEEWGLRAGWIDNDGLVETTIWMESIDAE